MNSNPRKVSYIYDENVGSYYYGEGHPMKPNRVRLAHNLICGYELFQKMDVYEPTPASTDVLLGFHKKDYIDFLSTVSVDNSETTSTIGRRFGVGRLTDCPIFDGMYEFSKKVAGGSVGAASLLEPGGSADIAIHWAGGLHHAKRGEASGFCYVNDIVLGILELLKHYERVLYIDIDVHHGDGVEEAFLATPRVFTLSVHQHAPDFFPGTGSTRDVGAGPGKYYSLNVPLSSGMDDSSFEKMFNPIIDKIFERYKPEAVVLQCGADSLAHDRLGKFNLTLHGHSQCVRKLKSCNVPLLLLGGGGYTTKNVARC